MLQATHDIKLTFSHIAGVHNPVADALSRAHTTRAHYSLAEEYITNDHLCLVKPCSYVLIHPPILCRSGAELVAEPGGAEADTCTRAGHDSSAPHNRGRPGSILHEVQHRSTPHVRKGRLHMVGISGHQGHISRYSQEKCLTSEYL